MMYYSLVHSVVRKLVITHRHLSIRWGIQCTAYFLHLKWHGYMLTKSLTLVINRLVYLFYIFLLVVCHLVCSVAVYADVCVCHIFNKYNKILAHIVIMSIDNWNKLLSINFTLYVMAKNESYDILSPSKMLVNKTSQSSPHFWLHQCTM